MRSRELALVGALAAGALASSCVRDASLKIRHCERAVVAGREPEVTSDLRSALAEKGITVNGTSSFGSTLKFVHAGREMSICVSDNGWNRITGSSSIVEIKSEGGRSEMVALLHDVVESHRAAQIRREAERGK